MCRILDNLPVAVRRQRRDGSQSTTYEHGFRVGFKGNYAGVSSWNPLLLYNSYRLINYPFVYPFRVKSRSILSITTWASGLCIIRILRLILLELLGLRFLQTGFVLHLFLSIFISYVFSYAVRFMTCVDQRHLLVRGDFCCLSFYNFIFLLFLFLWMVFLLKEVANICFSFFLIISFHGNVYGRSLQFLSCLYIYINHIVLSSCQVYPSACYICALLD